MRYLVFGIRCRIPILLHVDGFVEGVQDRLYAVEVDLVDRCLVEMVVLY